MDTIRRWWGPIVLSLFAAWYCTPRSALAQAPTIEPTTSGFPGSGDSLLGRSPGATESSLGTVPGTEQPTIGGAPGARTPRVPPSITTPGGTTYVRPPVGIAQPPVLPASELPIAGSLTLPTELENAGPPD